MEKERMHLDIKGAFRIKSVNSSSMSLLVNNDIHIYCDNTAYTYIVLSKSSYRKDLFKSVGTLQSDIIDWLVNEESLEFNLVMPYNVAILERVETPKSGIYEVYHTVGMKNN